jgi:heme A synthase
MTSASTAERETTTAPTPARSKLYSTLIGLAALAVLLQGLWAGLFVHEGKDYQQFWVDVHARGAELSIALAAAATVTAYVKLRARRDLLIGSAVLTGLLVVEAYLGGLIGDSPAVTAVHFPLALALTALVVWLPLRARR